MSGFDGSNPNGTWRLFVQDQNGEAYLGAFMGGWELEIMAKVKVRKTRQGWPYRIARQLDLYTGPLGSHTVDTHPGAVFRFPVTIQKAGRRC